MRRGKRWRLAIRLLRTDTLHAALIAVVCLLATGLSIVFAQASRARSDALLDRVEHAYGTVAVLPAPSQRLEPYPHVAHLPGDDPGWLPLSVRSSLYRVAAEIARDVHPRIRGALYVAEIGIAEFLAIGAEDPSYRYAAELPVPAELPALSMALQLTDEGVEMVAVPASALVGIDEENRYWLSLDWVWAEISSRFTLPSFKRPGLSASLRPQTESLLATEMVVMDQEADGFALAFEIESLLDNPEAMVLAYPERLGVERYGATSARAPTARLALFLVAGLTLAGATSLSVKRRTATSVTLRVMGVSELDLIRVYVTEVTIIALGAAALVFGIALGGRALFEWEIDPRILRRTIVFGVAIPVIASFLTVRRQLKASLSSELREMTT